MIETTTNNNSNTAIENSNTTTNNNSNTAIENSNTTTNNNSNTAIENSNTTTNNNSNTAIENSNTTTNNNSNTAIENPKDKTIPYTFLDNVYAVVDIYLSKPEDIQKNIQKEFAKLKNKYSNMSDQEIQDILANRIISRYSTFIGISGGITSLSSTLLPGLGTIVATTGGVVLDMTLIVKYQIDMMQSLAMLYGYNIEDYTEKKAVAVLTYISNVSQKAIIKTSIIAGKAFEAMAKLYFKGAGFITIKAAIKHFGITLSRSAFAKAIPFGIGVILSFVINKILTHVVGQQGKEYYSNKRNSELEA